MNHKEKLLDIYNSVDITFTPTFEKSLIDDIDIVGEQIKHNQSKGVYTVLITLVTHKILYPSQDIRNHQDNMTNGFSGRTIDTKYITPTLKELELPSMSESGWLTRSLEQPYPYNSNYEGKITPKSTKTSFLNIINFIETNTSFNIQVLKYLLRKGIESKEHNKIEVTPLKNKEKITINNLVKIFKEHFGEKYHISGGSKLPVLSFYSIYQVLVKEMGRFNGCYVDKLGNHTTCDTTSNSSGDIEIYKGDELLETLEIKLDKEIDKLILLVCKEKIIKHNPKRYYILSCVGTKREDLEDINNIIDDVREKHGCQIIVNGVNDSLKYYMRLLSSVEDFFEIYCHLVSIDKELKPIHKEKLNELIEKYINS
ncbi:DNA methyltransferase [Arcobacter suis]|uniref:Uncharacterized protein n=1 Tax=Arcobacter suis CECT 7833 TaxID=663365 RepID=A0AAD0WQ82_9BACT|nr:DNA methyltransferase [Arcobacter suis]AXX89520.1 hypothetical protein ASUIS_1032 [Arcobacter suis CECT 7833]